MTQGILDLVTESEFLEANPNKSPNQTTERGWSFHKIVVLEWY